jgi:hypothetical protein
VVFACLAAAPPGESGLLRFLLRPGLPLLAALLLAPVSLWLRPTLEVGNPRSLVVIGVDTLRMDRTSLAPGDERARTLTPAIAALAAQGAVFSEATTQAPWTLPAFASLFTGRYPAEHGATALQGLLRRREQTLAELLCEAGYQTGAVVSHIFVDRRRGLAQGFDDFDESNIGGDQDVTGEGVTDSALAWLARHRGAPFFLFVHYFDPHYEYRDHEEWDFADGGGERLRGLYIDDLRARLATLTPADVRRLRGLYDEEVAYTDRAIGRLLAALPADVAVALVGDHGEELLEHDWLGHTVSLRREVTRVPLVLRLPGATRPGSRIAAPVETRGLFATLLDYLDVKGAQRDDATSLLPLLDDAGASAPERTVFSQVWLPDQPELTGGPVRRSLARRGSRIVIRDHDTGTDRFYSVDEHGSETQAAAPAPGDPLVRELDAWTRRMDAARGAVPTRGLSEEERRRLEALGYLAPRP